MSRVDPDVNPAATRPPCEVGGTPHEASLACEDCGTSLCRDHARQVAADGPAIWLCVMCAGHDERHMHFTAGGRS